MKKLLTLLLISLSSFTSFLFADLGPKPTMSVIIGYSPADLNKVLSGELIQYYSGDFMACDILSRCNTQKVLENLGPQSFSCGAYSCQSASYGYTKYNKIVLYFADGSQKETNVFLNTSFNAKYRILVTDKVRIYEDFPLGSDEQIVQIAHALGYTKYDTVKSFMRDKPITREQATKFFGTYIHELAVMKDGMAHPEDEVQFDVGRQCSKFYDESAFDLSLKESIYKLCSYGLMKGSKGNFSPKNNISFLQTFIVYMRINESTETRSTITEQFVKETINAKFIAEQFVKRSIDAKFMEDTATSFLKPYLSDYNQAITRGDLLKLLILASAD